jgi:hypothetical protein
MGNLGCNHFTGTVVLAGQTAFYRFRGMACGGRNH